MRRLMVKSDFHEVGPVLMACPTTPEETPTAIIVSKMNAVFYSFFVLTIKFLEFQGIVLTKSSNLNITVIICLMNTRFLK